MCTDQAPFVPKQSETNIPVDYDVKEQQQMDFYLKKASVATLLVPLVMY